MRFRYAYLLLVLVAILSGWATYLALLPGGTRTVLAPSPIVVHAPCMQTIAGPAKLYACSDGRGYLKQRGIWLDVGPLTRAGVVPLR